MLGNIKFQGICFLGNTVVKYLCICVDAWIF